MQDSRFWARPFPFSQCLSRHLRIYTLEEVPWLAWAESQRMYALNPLKSKSKADAIILGSFYPLNVGAVPKSPFQNPFSLPKNLLHDSDYSTYIN